MRRGIHTLLFGLMTVLNGTVMLIGPGLHSLPGCGHGMVASRDEGSSDEGFHVVSGDGISVASCPICDYLAQGQVAAEMALAATTIVSAPALPIRIPIPSGFHTPRRSRPRAPPLLAKV